MNTVTCTGCGKSATGLVVPYVVKTERGEEQRFSVRPPSTWGVRSMDHGQSTVMFCDECRAKLARGEMKV